MKQDNKEMFQEVANAIKYGAVYGLVAQNPQLSYNGKHYTIKPQYKIISNDPNMTKVGFANKKKLLLSQIFNFAANKKFFTSVVIRDFCAEDLMGGKKPVEDTFTFTGLKNFRLCLLCKKYLGLGK